MSLQDFFLKQFTGTCFTMFPCVCGEAFIVYNAVVRVCRSTAAIYNRGVDNGCHEKVTIQLLDPISHLLHSGADHSKGGQRHMAHFHLQPLLDGQQDGDDPRIQGKALALQHRHSDILLVD